MITFTKAEGIYLDNIPDKNTLSLVKKMFIGKEVIIETYVNDYSNLIPMVKIPSSKLLNSFYMSKYLITQSQFEKVMGYNPSSNKGENHPVEMVSWNEATEFCNRLANQSNELYRLPTVQEWEYVYRGIADTDYPFEDELGIDISDYCWWSRNSQGHTHPVGLKLPNSYGVYDMMGNVAQWCEDSLYHTERIIKGTSALTTDVDSFVYSNREWLDVEGTSTYLGFRIVY